MASVRKITLKKRVRSEDVGDSSNDTGVAPLADRKRSKQPEYIDSDSNNRPHADHTTLHLPADKIPPLGTGPGPSSSGGLPLVSPGIILSQDYDRRCIGRVVLDKSIALAVGGPRDLRNVKYALYFQIEEGEWTCDQIFDSVAAVKERKEDVEGRLENTYLHHGRYIMSNYFINVVGKPIYHLYFRIEGPDANKEVGKCFHSGEYYLPIVVNGYYVFEPVLVDNPYFPYYGRKENVYVWHKPRKLAEAALDLKKDLMANYKKCADELMNKDFKVVVYVKAEYLSDSPGEFDLDGWTCSSCDRSYDGESRSGSDDDDD